jgi:hypothetical protein
VLVRHTERGNELDERSPQVVITADEAGLEPLSQRQRDAVASALKRLLVCVEPTTSGSWAHG